MVPFDLADRFFGGAQLTEIDRKGGDTGKFAFHVFQEHREHLRRKSLPVLVTGNDLRRTASAGNGRGNDLAAFGNLFIRFAGY